MPMKIIPLPSIDRVREIFDYAPATGILTAKISRHGSSKGSVIGTVTEGGRLICRLDYKIYYVSRLIWLHYYGVEPPDLIDHINGNTLDNRISNLRPADGWQNMWNKKGMKGSKSGIKGAHWSSLENKWRSSMKRDGKTIHLGWFNTKEEAAAAYESASRKAHGEYSIYERPS